MLSQQVINDFKAIKETDYKLNIHLQRIDEKLARIIPEGAPNSASVNLQDEKEVTTQFHLRRRKTIHLVLARLVPKVRRSVS